MYVYTEVQVQFHKINRNKPIYVITNNDLRCMTGKLLKFVLKYLQEDTQTTH